MTRAAPNHQVIRLMSTVAWLYHTRGLRQGVIAQRLRISQSRVSRLLEQAVDLGVVRTVVVLPDDVPSVLEQELVSAYGLRKAHVHELGTVRDETELVRDLGQLLALRLPTMLQDAPVVGFTSWSRTLQEAVRTPQPCSDCDVRNLVEMVGDLGPPTLQHLAAEQTQRLAGLTGAEPMFLRVPGVMADAAISKALLEYDSHARQALDMLDALDFAVTGIGAGGIVPPLPAGDNFFTEKQVAQARKRGAVGELNLRYIDEEGEPVHTDVDDLIVGITLEQLRRADRRLGVAGGPSKYQALRAALLGRVAQHRGHRCHHGPMAHRQPRLRNFDERNRFGSTSRGLGEVFSDAVMPWPVKVHLVCRKFPF